MVPVAAVMDMKKSPELYVPGAVFGRPCLPADAGLASPGP